MKKISTTIHINNDTSNPIAVDVTVTGDYEFLRGWDFEINEITRVELVISDKEGIDITKQVLSNSRAKALILSQVANEDDQIAEALDGDNDANEQIDEMREESLFEQAANIARSHAKIFYGIDLNGKNKAI
jgi:hypothetical protein